MKQPIVGGIALLVLGATLGASTPAQAQFQAPYGPLYCVAGDADPDFGASDQWAFSIDWRSGFAGSTDGRGNYFRYYHGTAYGPDYGDGGFFVWVQVRRLNPDGTSMSC